MLISFKGDLEDLRRGLNNKLHDYWSLYDVRNKLNDRMYGSSSTNSITKYILSRYESKIQNAGYSIGELKINNLQIEHISPQDPGYSQVIASGYEVDENNKYEENYWYYYLPKLGNLMLISGSHNASIGNKPFIEKLESYNNNPLLRQQAEIKTFIDIKSPKWGKTAISKRHTAIVEDFAIKEWDFNSLEV